MWGVWLWALYKPRAVYVSGYLGYLVSVTPLLQKHTNAGEGIIWSPYFHFFFKRWCAICALLVPPPPTIVLDTTMKLLDRWANPFHSPLKQYNWVTLGKTSIPLLQCFWPTVLRHFSHMLIGKSYTHIFPSPCGHGITTRLLIVQSTR